MDKQNAGVVFILLLTCVLAGQAIAQSSGIKFNSNADDLMKINSVLEQFRQDIVHKDGYALTKLVLNSNVLFHSVTSQAEVDSAQKHNAQFDGIGPSALDGFAQFLATSKDKLEETFHNIEIHQDGDLGLATFNYDFLVNDKVTNSGVEHWILCRVDGQWKILSLVSTSYDAKNQATHATAKQMALPFPNALRLIEMRKRAGIPTILTPWSWLIGASRNLVGFGLIAGIRARCKEF